MALPILTLLQTLTAASTDCGETRPLSALAMSPRELAMLDRCAHVGAVLSELLQADTTNAALHGGEVFNLRQRGALIDALQLAFDRVSDLSSATRSRAG